MTYHPDLVPVQPATVEHAMLFHKAFRALDRWGNVQVASGMLTIKPNVPKLNLQPLPEMWWEDEEGNKFVPDFSKDTPDFPPPGVYPYAHSRFPLEITHQVYKVRDDGGYGTDDQIMGMNTSLGGSAGDLAIAIRQVEGITLGQALGILSTACERCHNILADHYGFPDGYAKDSEEAARSGTHCELCAQIDPEYDEKVRHQEAGLYGPNVITASLNLSPVTIVTNAGRQFLSYLSFASAEETVRVSLMEHDSFRYMLRKHMFGSELAQLHPDDQTDFNDLCDGFHRQVRRDPSLSKAREFLDQLGPHETVASTAIAQTNAFIRYLTLSTLSSPEKATVEHLIPLRDGCNAFLQRFRYKPGSLVETAKQTLFKFEPPAAVLGYQRTLLLELSRCVLNHNPEAARAMALFHLKYLQDPALPGLIHNP